MADRFYVETSDEYGPTELDAFPLLDEAINLARQIVSDGWRYAVVVDRDEMCPKAMFGTVPSDWL